MEIPDFVWSDIEEVLGEDVMPFLLKPTVNSRAIMRQGMEHIIRMVDAVRAKEAKVVEKSS